MQVLALIVAALFALGILSAIAPKPARSMIMAITVGLCAAGAVASLPALLSASDARGLDLPLGPPGYGMRLAVDGLSGMFLLLLFVVGTACSVYALDPQGQEDGRAEPFFPALIGAMALTLLAGDGFALVLGFTAMSLTSWAALLARHEEAASREAALLHIGIAGFGVACLIPALVLLSPSGAGAGMDFAAIRAAAPPEGWRGTLLLALVLLGAGSSAGLAPLHVWMPRSHSAAPGHLSALMSGAMTKVALYMILRLLLDLAGPAQPLWWGLPLIVMGLASAVLGALRANVEGNIKSVLAAGTIGNVGLIAIGIGVALIARAADQRGLAALAMGGALLHAVHHGVFKTLLFLCAGSVEQGAGSRALTRLGGLIHRMPVTTACVLAGGLGLAALPPGSGFASLWMVLQSVLAAPRIGGLGLQVLFAIAAGLIAMAAALAAAATVRLIGVAFLGRPRTPRAAAADEAGTSVRAALIGLAGLSLLLGLLPGPTLQLIAPALRLTVGSTMYDQAGLLMLRPASSTFGYAAPAVAVLLGLAFAFALLALRRWGSAAHREGPAWACGFAAAPAWLPFGDPLIQYGGASFAQPIRRVLGTMLLAAREQVDTPEPGDASPASFSVSLQDPAETYLFTPLARIHHGIGRLADTIQFLPSGRALMLVFVALILLLAAIVALEAR